MFYKKFVDLVECNISQNNHITQDVRPFNCSVIACMAHGRNVWRSLLYTKSCFSVIYSGGS